MSLKDEMAAYQQRWAEIEARQAQEQRSASLELRWQQLNAAYGMAKALGLLQPDPSEMEVYERWARLNNPELWEEIQKLL
jgi:hypothetical protein